MTRWRNQGKKGWKKSRKIKERREKIFGENSPQIGIEPIIIFQIALDPFNIFILLKHTAPLKKGKRLMERRAKILLKLELNQ